MTQQSSSGAKRVFISHASSDRAVADSLCQAIESRGVVCWIATRDIPPSDNYQDSIVQAIEGASAMVLVFTVNCNNSSEIKKEVALAGQFLVPVIPVRVEDVSPIGAFRYELINRQWIDLFRGWDNAIDRIVQKIRDTSKDGVPIRTRTVDTHFHGRPSKKALYAISAAMIVTIAAIGYIRFLKARDSDLDPRPEYPETSATRLNSFTLCTPPTEYKAGFRKWVRTAPDRWSQTYPDGSKQFANVVGRTRAGDCDGSILGSKLDVNFQAFLPDTNCPDMQFFFRRLPKREWNSYVQMEDINEESRGCAKK